MGEKCKGQNPEDFGADKGADKGGRTNKETEMTDEREVRR